MNATTLRIALRADASTLCGTGHVRRCLSLAAALREIGAEVRLVTRRLGLDMSAMACMAGVDSHLLSAPTSTFASHDKVPHATWAGVDWRQDAAQTTDALLAWEPDCVVVDHYAFDARWHRHVADQLGARIAAIDDLADRSLEVQYLIDHNLSRDHHEKYRTWIGPHTTVLGGPRFALLGPSYSTLQPLRVDDTVNSIGIFMGGVDAANLSTLALQACREYAGFTGPIEIAATPAYPHLAFLAGLACRWPDTTVVCDLPDLSGFFTRHDLQIGAGGGATWERCCAGAPTLTLTAAANQRAVIPALADLGAVATLEYKDGEEYSPEVIGLAVSALLNHPARRRNLARCARALVDGLGARRVAFALAAGSLKLRRALPSDAVRTFAWRNHPSTRRFSRDSRELTLEEHRNWWQSMLADRQHVLFVADLGPYDVGVLRLDLDGEDAEISVYLDPAFTGLGLGQAMLRAAQRWARDNPTPAIKRLVAHILPSNAVSRKAFTSVGFEPTEGYWIWNVVA
ncbi:MAG: UDP-2,4-diacetamido-2,4,6-trideoxy-beta-L-altropyranose hydrolase [Burkholderiaceae bacterium]|nr:UDP-2,4-diacetamido-2,4,6-trideoxy-beta-L-altropyranose hydrolase [Burkholderiaceae bacterium]MDH3459503.1 UDP-2,4-diacetamido-2,4,6-trideoxy-beta-L-altropyranose hydrolase [Burkholderiaceae bacterium]